MGENLCPAHFSPLHQSSCQIPVICFLSFFSPHSHPSQTCVWQRERPVGLGGWGDGPTPQRIEGNDETEPTEARCGVCPHPLWQGGYGDCTAIEASPCNPFQCNPWCSNFHCGRPSLAWDSTKVSLGALNALNGQFLGDQKQHTQNQGFRPWNNCPVFAVILIWDFFLAV